MQKYLAFITWLVAFGTKLPKILAALETLVEAIAGTVPAPPPGEDSLQLVCDTTAATEIGEPIKAQVLEAETKVANLVAGPNAAWDGSRLRGLFKFLQESGLLDILLKKVIGG